MLFVIPLGTLAVNGESPATWSQWRGPSRDGSLSSKMPWPDQLEGKLEEVWSHPHGPSYSGPVSTDNLIFTTETVDQKFERVTAYDLSTGESKWTHQWEGSMAVPFFAAANGSWIRSTPACVPGYLVVLGMRDVLVCLDTATGEERWKIDFPAQFSTPLQSFGAACSPVIVDEHVYVQLGGGLTKIGLQGGKVVWNVLGGGGNMMSSGAFSSPTVATVAGTKQLLVQTREKLCGVSLETGEVYWSEPIEAFRGMNILTPTVIGDKIFTAAHSGVSQLFEITHDDQWKVTEVWNQKTQGYMSSPVVIDEQIYLHMKNERVACLSVADGEIQWTSPPASKYWSMVHNGDRILALSADGQLRLVEATPEKYEVTDTAKVAEDSWAYLAVIDAPEQPTLVAVRALDKLTVYRWAE